MCSMNSAISDLQVGKNNFIEKIKPLSKRILVIYGLNGAGKDSIKDKLLETGNFIYNIKSTSRNIKKEEFKDIDYHYFKKDSENFNEIKNGSIVSYSFLSNCYWDDAEEIYINLISNPDKYIILIMGNIIGFKKFLTVLPNVKRICILPENDRLEIIEESKYRMLKRNRDNIYEIEERLATILSSLDELIEVADLVVINKRNQLEESIKIIIKYLIKNKLLLTI